MASTPATPPAPPIATGYYQRCIPVLSYLIFEYVQYHNQHPHTLRAQTTHYPSNAGTQIATPRDSPTPGQDEENNTLPGDVRSTTPPIGADGLPPESTTAELGGYGGNYPGLTNSDGSRRTQMGPPAHSVTLSVLPTVTERQVAESERYIFDMHVIAERLRDTTMAADPKMAANNLSIGLQLKLTQTAKITVGPLDVRVFFEQYPIRMFICSIPRCLEPHFIRIRDEITHTGDDSGNKYKLRFDEHDGREYKQIAQKADERCWFHLISTAPDCTMNTRETFKAANAVLINWGFTINPETFKNLADSSNERGSGKYHADYTLDMDRVQLASLNGGTYDDREIDLSGLRHFTVEDEGGTQWPMKVWFKPAMFYAIFGERNCAKCYKGGRICQCNLVQHTKESGKKRAAEREQAYAKRKAKVAATNFDF